MKQCHLGKQMCILWSSYTCWGENHLQESSKKDFFKNVSQATEKNIQKLEDISTWVKNVHTLFFYCPSKRKERQSETFTYITNNYAWKSSFAVYTNYKRDYFEKLVENMREQAICPFCQKLNIFPIWTQFSDKIGSSLEMKKTLHLVNK